MLALDRMCSGLFGAVVDHIAADIAAHVALRIVFDIGLGIAAGGR